MCAFLDKKSSLLDAKISEYGRELLSKGIYNPVFFTLSDQEIPAYLTGSSDDLIESQPVFEPTSDIDFGRYSLFSNGADYRYPKITTSITGSIEIIRRNSENLQENDVVLSAVSQDPAVFSNKTIIETRMNQLINQGKVSDSQFAVEFLRSFTDIDPMWKITVELSASDGNHQTLFSSGSTSFGFCDDNIQDVSETEEINISNTFFEIVKVVV